MTTLPAPSPFCYKRRIMHPLLQRAVMSLHYRLGRLLNSDAVHARAYAKLVSDLKGKHPYDDAMRLAVGGEFEQIGRIEFELLRSCGLKSDDYLIDIGCGSGRLAKPLSADHAGKYLGTDISPELLDYARELVGRRDWRFEVATGLTIPEQDGQADMVCFFSVLTHLLHEESYSYLTEAKRVLKPGKKIVLSFLDFTVDRMWEVFEGNIRNLQSPQHPLNQFISQDAIHVWAKHLGMKVESLWRGDESFVPLSSPITFPDGRRLEGSTTLGQSVCVLVK
ncbi:MAG: class I SAM-dependent methyltransferase [Pyrinomonadaceae bacterium]